MKNFLLIMLSCMMISACGGPENESTTESNTPETTRFADVDQSSAERINNIYTAYLDLKNALVETDAAKASESARMLSQTAKEFDFEPLQPDARVFLEEKVASIEEKSESIAGSTDVEQQREHFYPLSQDMYQVMKSFHTQKEPVYYQYCPMAFDDKGAYWLSNEKQIRNPYFGDVMLKCGEVREVIE